jgi:RHS repeat-associated protein
MGAEKNPRIVHNDHLGTPQKMTDASANVVWAADYLPFGQASVTVGAVENNLRFRGQYYDQETGLHYNYHRYYDPTLGRYLRADPIGLSGGINLYTYVGGNPVNTIDPYGLCWSNKRAVAHYINPFSGDVTLGQTGCVGEVSSATESVRNAWKNSVGQKAEAAAKSLKCPGGGSKAVTFSGATGVHSGVFWIGGIKLSQRATCSVKKDCSKCTWSYSCSISNSMNDKFVQPFDFNNSNSDPWDNVEVGRPFYVTHTWVDSVSDSGKYK